MTSSDWELLTPEGAVITAPMQLARRIASLEGKTVALRWNGKPHGEILLNRTAALLQERIPALKIIKLYEVEKSTIHASAMGQDRHFTEAEAGMIYEKYKPDLVIGAQGD